MSYSIPRGCNLIGCRAVVGEWYDRVELVEASTGQDVKVLPRQFRVANTASSVHPIWSIIRLTILLAAFVTIMWLNASTFDDTEIKALAWMGAVLLSVEYGQQPIATIVQMFTNRSKKDE